MFRKIREEEKSLKSLEPVALLSVERVNTDTKVLCVPGFLKGIKSRAGKEIVEEVDEAGRLTRSGRCYSLEELEKRKMAQNIRVPLKKAVTQQEVEDTCSKETTVNQLEELAKRIFESNTITLTDDELPTEGARHNRALLLTVKCEGYYVNEVMIDGGFGVEICPFSTLQSLKINPYRIRSSNVFVRAYDG
ncbi:hypothetical protein H5410_045593 [Solanum commersonii]|uniref:Uncharacterized protein n=1 Tax=Solanum commersonii TaxID=4109 RepID=A0A9J5XC29_SOLCO|nr:hypothetical protein H5410_045593 [Solanum commersonii]